MYPCIYRYLEKHKGEKEIEHDEDPISFDQDIDEEKRIRHVMKGIRLNHKSKEKEEDIDDETIAEILERCEKSNHHDEDWREKLVKEIMLKK